MNTTQIDVAMALPEDLINKLETYVSSHDLSKEMEHKIPTKQEIISGPPLGFDPITGGAFVWVVLTFLGTTSVSIAVNVISDFIYDYFKDRKGKNVEIPLRLSNGKVIIIKSDAPLTKEELERFLRD